MFAAWGISHDGKRTIPTARNTQNLKIYAVTEGGIWLYNAQKHVLELASRQNITDALALQDFVREAPLTLVFVEKPDDKGYAAMNAGASYQNVGLYCASRGLHNVVRGMVNRDKIAEALGISADEVLITQTIGWPYM